MSFVSLRIVIDETSNGRVIRCYKLQVCFLLIMCCDSVDYHELVSSQALQTLQAVRQALVSCRCQASKLKYSVNALGTVVEGPAAKVWKVCRSRLGRWLDMAWWDVLWERGFILPGAYIIYI